MQQEFERNLGCWLGFEAISRRCELVGSALAATILLASSASGQVTYKEDFEVWPLETGPGVSSYGYPPLPVADAVVSQEPQPRGHVLTLSVDASSCTAPWAAWWHLTVWDRVSMGYYPDRTFLAFDAMASELKPFRVKLIYTTSYLAGRNLEIYVTPHVAASFERFTVPLSAFEVTELLGDPPDFLTSVEFGIQGDPTNSVQSWGMDAGNTLQVDNLVYFMVPPPLHINLARGSVVATWATNSVDYVLQQNDLPASTGWADVNLSPVVTNGLNQVVLSPANASAFYRLRSP